MQGTMLLKQDSKGAAAKPCQIRSHLECLPEHSWIKHCSLIKRD
jgi:hypothetical protein